MKKILFLVIVMFILSTMTVAGKTCPPDRCPPDCCNDNVDKWANSVVDKSKVDNAKNALGADDNKYADIKDDYGYLILDMGEGEEICDMLKFDMKVYGDSTREKAEIYVSNNPSSGFEYVGTIDGKGDKMVDIGSSSYDKVRYIKIYNPSKFYHVEIDAIEGMCINCPGNNDVPEFGVLATLGILGIVGLFVYRKRR